MGWANASAYCGSNGALTGVTQALGADVRPHGVRACLIYPRHDGDALGRVRC